MRFAGKTVIVTGFRRENGLGQGIPQRFADEGANCANSDFAIGYLCGIKAGAPPIVKLLERYDIMASWTVAAMALENHPEIAEAHFNQLWREGEEDNPETMSMGLHLRIIGRPGRIWDLEEFFKRVRAHSDVWVTTRRAIAEHFIEENPE